MTHDRLHTLIERLGNLTQAGLRSAGAAHGLQPAPLLALSFLAKANRYSDTPAALADYLGLSRAATSQTLALLEERGLVAREQDEADRRVWHLALTRAGRRIVEAAMPPPPWGELLAQLPPKEVEQLQTALEGVLRFLQAQGGVFSFGVCSTCRHHRRDATGAARCGLTGEPLPVEQTLRICREHAHAPA